MKDKGNQKINKPFFSVVIPVYNKGPHISRSIISVLNQSFKNYEVILINDASTDDSLEEIKNFTDERIRLFQRTEPGPGGYAARNLGIKKARGEWIAFLDADDEWYPEHLEKMYELAQKYPDVYFMGCGWEIQDKGDVNINSFYKSLLSKGPLKISLLEYLKYRLSGFSPVWTSVACVRKISPVIFDFFPSNFGVRRGGDLHAWLKMMCYHKEIVLSNHIGAIYHRDSTNMVTKNVEYSFHLQNKDVYKSLSENLKENERKLLLKYFNYKIYKSWKDSTRLGFNNVFIMRKLFWRGDIFNAIKYSIISCIPISAIKLYRKIAK